MRIFEPHIHMFSRTTDDYERMALAGIRATIEQAFWLGQPRQYAGSFFDYFAHLLNYEVTFKAHYPKLWTSFTIFDANLEGLIARAPGTFLGSPTFQGEPVFQRQNIDEAEIMGAELDFGWWPA